MALYRLQGKFVAVAIKKLSVSEFLEMAKEHPVLDVRSPGEFEQAHIPGAYSLPLFTDEERKVVGTAYKQESREKAIKIGLEYFGKKMVKMVEEVEEICDKELGIRDKLKTNPQSQISNSRKILVHCWRGGMRSTGVAWLLDLYGFDVHTLAGGYKAYRNWVLQQFEKEYNIHVIGGYTGSAKSYVLNELQKQNEAVVDLEGLANHKGSAFGHIGMPKQPSQEMFENRLAQQLSSFSSRQSAVIWIEDESQRIGNVNIPTPFFKQMRTKSVLFLDIPFEERLKHIIAEYGRLEKEKMINAIIRIKKRLGGLDTKNAISYLVEDNVEECFGILLRYYDKAYEKAMQTRDNWQQLVTKVECINCNASANADKLIKIVSQQTEPVNG